VYIHGADARKKKWTVDRIFPGCSPLSVIRDGFCGFLVDMFYGSVFGFYALIYMYIGFLSGYAHRICYDDDIKVPVMLAGIGDLLYGLSVYALQFLLRGRLGLGTYLYRIILPEIFYTVILTLIVYRVFHYINYHFMKNPSMKESESIWVLK
jgi:rod shape-determining protein MreD